MTHPAAQNVTPMAPCGPDVHRLEVVHVNADAYDVDIRGHRLLVDQPVAAGGTDVAPTPTEMFAASLATCVAFCAGRYLQRHNLSRRGLRVCAEFVMAADSPARIGSLRLTLTPPPALSAQRHAALLAVASRCTVHNTLRQPPAVVFELATEDT
ncbi:MULTISPECIES: OsmC family protein [unclassified Streptomyces]|uniref:OsmC family protein n=1 Tax=unclassified Streptomyces TaxID=2593676 RepID=UPI001BAEE019|nr:MULTISPECIES: OsmC family protein [unclassified Streptomyces]MDH6447665.1 putative redox protein [Streptomyces sp. SAI-119]MDH6501612.1 putative redox protein [Streptomyces sp. SAI-149]